MSVFFPLKNLPNYKEVLVLDNAIYEIGFTWNTRESAWHLSVAKNNTQLLSGIKIVNNWELIDRFAIVELPRGLFISVDIAQLNTIPGRDNFGDDFKLAYITESEKINGLV